MEKIPYAGHERERLINDRRRREVRPDIFNGKSIIKEICNKYDVGFYILTGIDETRNVRLINIRQECYYKLHFEFGMPYARIGRIFSHTGQTIKDNAKTYAKKMGYI